MRAGDMEFGGLGILMPVEGSTMAMTLRDRAAAAALALRPFIGELGAK